jgi:hypothetical protein
MRFAKTCAAERSHRSGETLAPVTIVASARTHYVAMRSDRTILYCECGDQRAPIISLAAKEEFVRSLGRLLQIVGLSLPILAIVMQVMEQVSVGQMLVMWVAAMCTFYIGRIMEGYARG